MRKSVMRLAVLFVMGWLFLGTGAVHAQYPEPNRTITINVNAPPGGATDIQIRATANYLSKSLGGAKVQIENIPGASGKIAYEKTFKAKPDGYTLLAVNLIGPIILELQEKDVHYKVLAFTPVYAISSMPFVLVVHTDMWKTLDDFLQEGQKRVVSIGTMGKNTGNYLQAAAFVEATKIKANLVPFAGGAESTTTLAGKHIDAVITPVISALPLVRGGKLRPLFVFSDDPDPSFPGVPISKESKWEIAAFPFIINFVGPPNLPDDRVKILGDAFSKALKDPAFMEWANKVNLEITPMGAERVREITVKTYQNAVKYGSFSDAEKK